ncbi:GatB/YqeY domain-containing protein, partial [Candidatus Hakubella thermalkaliphila]
HAPRRTTSHENCVIFKGGLPMLLKERVIQDMQNSLKKGDKIRLSTMRLLLSEIKNLEKEKRISDLSDDDVLSVVRREIKRRDQALEEFRKTDRKDLVDKEERERQILEEYLPVQLSQEELEAMVRRVIQETGASSSREMGKVMGRMMQEVKGKADGKRVRQIVERLLS